MTTTFRKGHSRHRHKLKRPQAERPQAETPQTKATYQSGHRPKRPHTCTETTWEAKFIIYHKGWRHNVHKLFGSRYTHLLFSVFLISGGSWGKWFSRELFTEQKCFSRTICAVNCDTQFQKISTSYKTLRTLSLWNWSIPLTICNTHCIYISIRLGILLPL